MAKLKGLGRGLDALLGGDEAQPQEQLLNVALTQLHPGKYQPRTQMDPGAIAELAESIKVQGVIQPILARPLSDGHFEIIAGERRWRAAKLAGLDSIPVLVREVRDDLALAMALIENIQREDLNPIEEAAGIQRLIDEFGMTHEAAAEAVGRSRSGVTNLLRLLSLAKPVQDLVLHGRLDMGHGRALLALSGAKQIELANLVVAKDLSVRQAEHLVAPGPVCAQIPQESVARPRSGCARGGALRASGDKSIDRSAKKGCGPTDSRVREPRSARCCPEPSS